MDDKIGSENIFNRLLDEANFDVVGSGIEAKNFTKIKEPDLEAELESVCFGKKLTTKQVINEARKRGKISVEIEYAFLYAKKYPNEQKKIGALAALGSVCELRGKEWCPFLAGYSGGRGIFLSATDEFWAADTYFLLRKKKIIKKARKNKRARR